MEESWRGADHTQTSWGAADRCHESTAVIGTARMEGGEAGMERQGGKKVGVGEGKWRSRLQGGGGGGGGCNEKCKNVQVVRMG